MIRCISIEKLEVVGIWAKKENALHIGLGHVKQTERSRRDLISLSRLLVKGLIAPGIEELKELGTKHRFVIKCYKIQWIDLAACWYLVVGEYTYRGSLIKVITFLFRRGLIVIFMSTLRRVGSRTGNPSSFIWKSDRASAGPINTKWYHKSQTNNNWLKDTSYCIGCLFVVQCIKKKYFT